MKKIKHKPAEILRKLAAKKDSEIDFSDLPEITDWSEAVRGMFYKPVKKSVTLRLDADVLAWFKAHSPKYQTALNAALRDFVMRQG
jgi:uncharacterized protein (DUF4415 family)